jgi:hypothetical protein
MNRPIRPRDRRDKEKEQVFRTPEEISDLAYKNFNTLANKSKLTDGTAHFANRLIREESFSKQELKDVRSIINGEEPTAEVSGEILGGELTLAWIKDVLDGKVAPQKAVKAVPAPDPQPGSKAKAALTAANG